jgi:hypothetical protein
VNASERTSIGTIPATTARSCVSKNGPDQPVLQHRVGIAVAPEAAQMIRHVDLVDAEAMRVQRPFERGHASEVVADPQDDAAALAERMP